MACITSIPKPVKDSTNKGKSQANLTYKLRCQNPRQISIFKVINHDEVRCQQINSA